MLRSPSQWSRICLLASLGFKFFPSLRAYKMFYKLLLSAALFYFLLPGVLVRLPPGGSTMTVNVTHAVVFAVVSHFAWRILKK